MSVEAEQRGKIDFGEVINETFGVLRRNILSVTVLSLLFSALPGLVVTFFAASTLEGIQPGNFNFSPEMLTGNGMSGLVALITTSILQGALIYGAVQDLSGARAPIGEWIATGLRNFLPLIAVSILFAIAVIAGTICLIVPGVMMACAWCVVVPCLVADRTGVFGAFRRAADLTRGNRWRILGLGVVLIILLWVLEAILGAIAGAATFATALTDPMAAALSPVKLAMGVVQNTISSAIASTFVAVLYVNLRRAREGLGSQWLSDVFR